MKKKRISNDQVTIYLNYDDGRVETVYCAPGGTVTIDMFNIARVEVADASMQLVQS